MAVNAATGNQAARRAERPRAAFSPERPNRLGVFRALTDRDPADDPHWRKAGKEPFWQDFDTYRHDEVCLDVHLRKRDRGSGSWVGVYATRRLAVTDPAEAWERLSGLGLCPAPGADPQRAFADYCEACGGIGTSTTGRRASCNGCSVARIGWRRRGCGYTLTDAPVGDDAMNAVAHWAMLGTPTILRAEELARETFARATPAGHPALRTVAWLPVVPRTWEPIAHRRAESDFAEEMAFRELSFASIVAGLPMIASARSAAAYEAAARLAVRAADRRSFDRLQNRRARAHLRVLDCMRLETSQTGVESPARELLDLGLALHDLDADGSVAVIAFPVQ
jgi:hypothetical protein